MAEVLTPTSDEVDVEDVRCARTQVLMREINEQLHLLRGPAPHERCEIVCECAGVDCLRPLVVGRAEYATVRRFPTRFIVAPGHEELEFERVVEDHGGYVVVEKTGAGAILAIRAEHRLESS